MRFVPENIFTAELESRGRENQSLEE